MNATTERRHAIFLVSIYLFGRLALDFIFWRTITPYAAYAFEVAFVIWAWWVFKKRISFSPVSGTFTFLDLLLPLLTGFAAYRLGAFAQIPIPFDLTSWETRLLLLVIAPVLEELIFRGALWEALRTLVKTNSHVLTLTSVLFAVGHFLALWSVPMPLRSFVLYQTLYVLVLGLAAGWRRIVTDSVISPILIHFCFNLGFFLAATVRL